MAESPQGGLDLGAALGEAFDELFHESRFGCDSGRGLSPIAQYPVSALLSIGIRAGCGYGGHVTATGFRNH